MIVEKSTPISVEDIQALIHAANKAVGKPPDYGVVNVELKYQDKKVVNVRFTKAVSYRV